MSYLSKVANFNIPHLHLGMTPLQFSEMFGHRNLDSQGYRVAFFRNPTFSRFHTIPGVTDTQTDTRRRHIPR